MTEGKSVERRSPLEREISNLLNRHSAENAANTPDFVLAEYLMACLRSFNAAVQARDQWYGIKPAPGTSGSGTLI